MQIPYLLLQTIVVPLITALACILLRKKFGKKVGWVASAAMVYVTILLAYVGLTIWSEGGTFIESYQWQTVVFDLKFGFLADGLSLPVALILSLLCAAAGIYSIKYIERRIEALYGKNQSGMYALYYALFLLIPVQLVGAALSTNTIELYLFLESGLVPLFVLLDLFGYNDRHRIAKMAFIWTQVGAALYLIGAVIAGVNLHSFDISALAGLSGTDLGFWVCLLILFGFLIKMGSFGFHIWIPYVDGEHATSVASVLAGMVGLGTYVLARLLYGEMLSSFQVFSLPLMILAVVTMIYAAFLTMNQDDVKRLFAYSTIGQTAYCLFGIASMTAMGVNGAVFYFLSHVIGKFLLFSVAGILVVQVGTRSIKEMGGLAHKMPLTALLCFLGVMVLSAIPPLSGFQAEWVLFTGVFTKGVTGVVYLIIALIGLFATFLTSVYTFWPAIRIFFGPLSPKIEKVKEAPLIMLIPMFLVAAVSVLIGIFPDLIMHFLA
jgi:formate hydrogenlyase subunit 3/multisubunit Na+/H+ antiporter MnhD subunit